MNARIALLWIAALSCGAASGCDDLTGLGGETSPLARIEVEVTGDLDPLRPDETRGETPHLAVALVWGTQWWPEPLCVVPPQGGPVTVVVEAGCPDLFGFVPDRVGANVDVTLGEPATLELTSLPAADVMIGDVTARVGYASLVVYDDRNGSRTLDLQETHGFGRGDGRGDGGGPPDGGDLGQPPEPDADIIYGASFVSMTEPDQRVAFREGAFNALAAFYPRAGCGDPPPGFSILSAGGFSAVDAYASILTGELPQEDPATCDESPLDEAVVTIGLRDPEPLRQLACVPRRETGITHYREPPVDAPELDNRPWACTGLPSFGEAVPEDVVQLVVASRPTDACKTLSHYLLRGCEHNPGCETPEWDRSQTPPDWWPCGDSP